MHAVFLNLTSPLAAVDESPESSSGEGTSSPKEGVSAVRQCVRVRSAAPQCGIDLSLAETTKTNPRISRAMLTSKACAPKTERTGFNPGWILGRTTPRQPHRNSIQPKRAMMCVPSSPRNGLTKLRVQRGIPRTDWHVRPTPKSQNQNPFFRVARNPPILRNQSCGIFSFLDLGRWTGRVVGDDLAGIASQPASAIIK